MDNEHAYRVERARSGKYVAICSCGWYSASQDSKPEAMGAASTHIAAKMLGRKGD